MPKEPKKPIEQVVSELGRYPMDAFMFVQECIGIASNQVYGPMSKDEETVARWMAKNDLSLDQLRCQYEVEDFPLDIAEAIQRIGGLDKMNRHVSGQQLSWAIRDTALKRWGMMARSVLTRWNIERTEDIGAIVFTLVENDWLQKQPTDSLEDYNNVFSFDEAFDQAYRIKS